MFSTLAYFPALASLRSKSSPLELVQSTMLRGSPSLTGTSSPSSATSLFNKDMSPSVRNTTKAQKSHAYIEIALESLRQASYLSRDVVDDETRNSRLMLLKYTDEIEDLKRNLAKSQESEAARNEQWQAENRRVHEQLMYAQDQVDQLRERLGHLEKENAYWKQQAEQSEKDKARLERTLRRQCDKDKEKNTSDDTLALVGPYSTTQSQYSAFHPRARPVLSATKEAIARLSTRFQKRIFNE